MSSTNETIKQSNFVLRRLEESFAQFREDLWAAVPVWLLVPAVLAVIARVWYARYYRRTHGPAKPDSTQYWLGWAAILTVGAFLAWTVVAFYKLDSAQMKKATPELSSQMQSNQRLWYIFTIGLFAVAMTYVCIQYFRDTRTVRWFWAAKLAIVRTAVYAVLLLVFLLPARQTVETTEKGSRVIILIDISPSMTRVSDDIARKGSKTKTRMETLIDLLTDKDVALLQNILKNNPIAVYPFGTRLDEASRMIERDTTPWGRDDWAAFAAYDFRPFLAQGLTGTDLDALRNTTNPVDWNGPKPSQGVDKVEPANWAEWASKWTAHRADWAAERTKAQNEQREFKKTLVSGISEEGNKTLAENIERLDRRIDVAKSIALGTNVPDSVAAAVNRESPNRVQGVIVFSDMRSNLGSDSSYRELRAAATGAKVPVFMIAVGEERQSTAIAITDIQTDDVASPDEGFKVSVEADGSNLAGKTVNVELDVFVNKPAVDPETRKPNNPDYTFKVDRDRGTPYQISFAPGDPPHGSVEFTINPEKLAKDPDPAARGLIGDLKEEEKKDPGKKDQPEEKKDEPKEARRGLKEGTWAVRARIARDENEAFPDEFHTRERAGIQVIQKKIRVLVVAGAPGREFQFLRTFLTREVLENRATVTLFVQNEAGTTGQLTPNPTEDVIGKFPNRLDLTGKVIDPKEKPYNLNEYDVIVAFDPDWTEFTQQQAEDLKLWVERQGGGFILVADRINTFQLARVEQGGRLSPVLEVLPVEPDDVIAVRLKTTPRTPRRLYMNPMAGGSDLLKIAEPPTKDEIEAIVAKTDADKKEKVRAQLEKLASDPVYGWELFFTGRHTYEDSKDYKVELFPKRGFFSCYPVKPDGVKPGAHVLAEFADVDDRNMESRRPYIVLSNPQANFRTAYIGSGELYRLHTFEPPSGKDYYDRFWAKLIKYMAAKRNVKASRGRVLTNKEVIAGTPIRVTAQLLNTNSKPYAAGAIDPKFSVLQVAANGEKKLQGPFPLASTGVEGYYKGQVNADPKVFPPGDYEYFAIVDVPDSPGETLRSNFRVLKSDLEMDVTKPDQPALLAMASDFDKSVQDRIQNQQTVTKLSNGLPKENGTPKLAFKLTDKELIKLIPECFKSDPANNTVKGPTDDLWDERVALFDINSKGTQEWLARNGFRNRADQNERAATPIGDFLRRGPRVFRSSENDTPPVDADGNVIAARPPTQQAAVSWVLLVVVFLLCWEWLTRKLLRLA